MASSELELRLAHTLSHGVREADVLALFQVIERQLAASAADPAAPGRVSWQAVADALPAHAVEWTPRCAAAWPSHCARRFGMISRARARSTCRIVWQSLVYGKPSAHAGDSFGDSDDDEDMAPRADRFLEMLAGPRGLSAAGAGAPTTAPRPRPADTAPPAPPAPAR